MSEQAKYEADVIGIFSRMGMSQPKRQPGISDEDRDGEFEASRIFYQALAAFRSDVSFRVLPRTSLRRKQIEELLDLMESETPDPNAWEIAIMEARRGE